MKQRSDVPLHPGIKDSSVTLLWYDAAADRSWSVPSEMADVYWANTAVGPGEPADYLTTESGIWLAPESW